MKKDNMQVIEIKGSPFERGKQYGHICKQAIRLIIEDHYDSIINFTKKRSKIEITRSLLSDLSLHYLPYIQDYSPDLSDELQGIAIGADVPLSEIVLLNCFLDIYDLVFPGLTQSILYGCTTFAVGSGSTINEEPIIAQNLDLRKFFKKYDLLIKIFPDDGINMLVYTVAGVVGLAGINNCGISLVFNKLTPIDSCYGVPYAIMCRKILQQTRIGSAIAAISVANRASGSFSIVGSPDAGIFGIEASSKDYQVFMGHSGYIAHSNHYIHQSMHHHNEYYFPYGGDSFVRLSQAIKKLEFHSTIDLLGIKELAKDHGNYPDSICRHSDESVDSVFHAETMASLIFLPKEKSCLISNGPPCQAEYQSVSIQ